jgi:uncharacterized membrane protein
MEQAIRAKSSKRGFDRLLHWLFETGIALKGAFALLEVVGGVALWLIPTAAIVAFVERLSMFELDRMHGDELAAWLMRLAHGFSMDGQSFYAIYLASHGLVKLVLVAGLFRGVRWAYPVSIVVMGCFIVFQLHRFAGTQSVPLLLISLFDALLIGLIWREWRRISPIPGR